MRVLFNDCNESGKTQVLRMSEEGSNSLGKNRTRRYVTWLIFVAILYDLFDSYATTLPSVINDLVIAGFHVTTDQYAFALGIFSLGTFFALVSQSIADRVGRKPMLFI